VQFTIRYWAKRSNWTLWASVLAVFTALALPMQTHAQERVLSAFRATYAAQFRGMDGGNLTFTFQPTGIPGEFIYQTTADPSFLASLVVSRAAMERSKVAIDAQGVRPLEWEFDDGKSSDKADGVLKFDWAAQRVTGRIERESIDFATEPGLQDRLSIQIAVMVALLRGEEPSTFPMIDDNRIKRYTYRKTGDATLDTPLGKVDTVIYESTRAGSSRVARFWMAPSYDYLAIRAEQERKGKVETVMTIKALVRGDEVK
jgi:hypothetical protein